MCQCKYCWKKDVFLLGSFSPEYPTGPVIWVFLGNLLELPRKLDGLAHIHLSSQNLQLLTPFARVDEYFVQLR